MKVLPGPRRDPISLEMQGGEWCNAPRMAHDRGSHDWELDELESTKTAGVLWASTSSAAV